MDIIRKAHDYARATNEKDVDYPRLVQFFNNALIEAYNAGLEEAAKECEDRKNWIDKITFGELAAAIRRKKS